MIKDMIEDILAELKKINHALEIQERMLETLIESDSQREYASQTIKTDVSNQVSGVFAMLKNNPIFKDNPDLLNMFDGLKSSINQSPRTEE